ncbi:TPA: efflux RND transporter periplasmic adaptor subunit [Candidatus Spyradomonas excrementavium]|nr:efflux RND transporter periplasmic adaptor subunit [Candidatus Spyradomonas excrementavium]
MDKKKLWIGIILAVMIVPIVFNKVMTVIGAKMAAEAAKRPQIVQVAEVKGEDIYQKTESVGRIEAKYSVDVVARINGWLQKRYFKEGDYVKKGQTLFLIQPNEYAIAVQQAQATVNQNQAALVNSEKELKRAQELVKNDFVSKSYYDQALATRDQNKAALEAARANLANAKLNLSYTRIASPVDGKIGKILITEGNLVNAQSGTLAKIVSTSPIYGIFTLKSEDYLKFKKGDNSDKDFSNMDVKIKLSDGSEYKETGKLEFVNNEVDPTAGTITLRATFQNKDHLLVPGDFINVTATSKAPRHVLLVPQVAVSDSTAGYYVWVIDKDGLAQQKSIKIGNAINTDWEVLEGLQEGEKVISTGVQKLRPGVPVKVEETPSNAQNSQTENNNNEKDNK